MKVAKSQMKPYTTLLISKSVKNLSFRRSTVLSGVDAVDRRKLGVLNDLISVQ